MTERDGEPGSSETQMRIVLTAAFLHVIFLNTSSSENFRYKTERQHLLIANFKPLDGILLGGNPELVLFCCQTAALPRGHSRDIARLCQGLRRREGLVLRDGLKKGEQLLLPTEVPADIKAGKLESTFNSNSHERLRGGCTWFGVIERCLV